MGQMSIADNACSGDHFGLYAPNVATIGGPLVVRNNTVMVELNLPHLETVQGNIFIAENPSLVEISAASLTHLSGDDISVINNPRLAFVNLAQAQPAIDYCDAFDAGDFTGNTVLLNVRTIWFTPSNCKSSRPPSCARPPHEVYA